MKHKIKKELVYYSGLYGDKQFLNTHTFLNLEPIESRSKLFNWQIKEHLHNDLYQVFMIKKGAGVFISDGKEWKIEDNSIIFIPSNTVHGFEFKPDLVGDVFTFSESLYDTYFRNSPNVQLQMSKFNILKLENAPELFLGIKTICDSLMLEMKEDRIEKETAIHLWFQLLVIELHRVSDHSITTMDYTEKRSLSYFKSFQKIIRSTVMNVLSVQEYAKSINITAVHLNRICNQVAGKSALEIVHDYRIAEAKKYLLNTNYTIAEVSNLLNFRDPAYFTRLFKKSVGVTPSEFKK
jgi:AraC family transcriptional regulator, transcriptional activator of pobA